MKNKKNIGVKRCKYANNALLFEGEHATPDFTWWRDESNRLIPHTCEHNIVGIADLIGWNIRDVS